MHLQSTSLLIAFIIQNKNISDMYKIDLSDRVFINVKYCITFIAFFIFEPGCIKTSCLNAARILLGSHSWLLQNLARNSCEVCYVQGLPVLVARVITIGCYSRHFYSVAQIWSDPECTCRTDPFDIHVWCLSWVSPQKNIPKIMNSGIIPVWPLSQYQFCETFGAECLVLFYFD